MRTPSWSWLSIPAAGVLLWACLPLGIPEDGEMLFELKGSHTALACADCHPASEPIGPLPTECQDCHGDDRPEGHYEGACSDCHNEVDWCEGVLCVGTGTTAFDHSFFPLEDAHFAGDGGLGCIDCHANAGAGDYTGLAGADCATCHEAEGLAQHGNGADLGGYANCAQCHCPTVWNPELADCGTGGTTTEPLTEWEHPNWPQYQPRHFEVDCVTCHGSVVPQVAVSKICGDCHGEGFDHADEPDPHWDNPNCNECHYTAPNFDWAGLESAHATPPVLDAFPLTFSHAVPGCADCHVDGYVLINPPVFDPYGESTCEDCHPRDYAGDPLHGWAPPFPGLPPEPKPCYDCHSTEGW